LLSETRNPLVRAYTTWSILFFLTGALCGATATFGYQHWTAQPKTVRADDFRHQYTKMMRDRLKLDDAQLKSLDAALDQTKARVEAVHKEYDPALQAIREDQYATICSFLNPTQKAEYDRIRAERKQKH